MQWAGSWQGTGPGRRTQYVWLQVFGVWFRSFCVPKTPPAVFSNKSNDYFFAVLSVSSSKLYYSAVEEAVFSMKPILCRLSRISTFIPWYVNFHPFSFSSAALLKYPLVLGKKAGGEQDTTVPSRWAWPRSPSLRCGHALGFGAMGFATFPGTPDRSELLRFYFCCLPLSLAAAFPSISFLRLAQLLAKVNILIAPGGKPD